MLAIAGFFLFGKSFFGGVIGFLIGSGIDNYQNIVKRAQSQGGQRGQQGRAFSPEDLFNYYHNVHQRVTFLQC